MRMPRLLKIVLSLFAILAALLAVSVALVYVNRDKIQASALQAVNERLNAKVSVGEISVSLVPRRYGVLLVLKNVAAQETQYVHGRPLVMAAEVSVAFAILPLLQARYEVSALLVKEAEFYPAIAKNGERNWENFLKPDSAAAEGMETLLRYLSIENSRCYYADRQSGDTLSTFADNLNLRGSISSRNLNAQLSGKAILYFFKNETLRLERERVLELSGQLLADGAEQTFYANDIRLLIGKLRLHGDFRYDGKEKNTEIQLALANSTKIGEILPLLPTAVLREMNGYEYDALVSGNMAYSERGNDVNLKVKYRVEKGSIKHREWTDALENMQMSGSYQFRFLKGRTFQQLEIPTLNASWKGSSLLGNIGWQADGKQTTLSGSLEGTLPAMLLNPWLNLDDWKISGGEVQFKLRFSGDPATAGNNWQRNTSGSVNLRSVALKSDSAAIDNISGAIALSGEVWTIENLTINAGESKLAINGKLQMKDSWKASLNLKADMLNTQDIPAFKASNTRSEKQVKYELDIQFEAGTIRHREVIISNALGKAILTNQKAEIQLIRANAFGGSFNADLFIIHRGNEAQELLFNGNTQNADIGRIMRECENFGQKELTSNNIMGKLDAAVTLTVELKKGSPMLSTLKSGIEVKIRNGRLLQYRPLLALSKFINEDELNDISFDELNTTIGIADGKILIPYINIKNSALDFSLSGEHYFNNNLQYLFEFRMADLVSARRRKLGDEQHYEVENNGAIKLHISMTGNINAPVIKYDKKKAGEALKEDLKMEKKALKEALKKEFGGKGKREGNQRKGQGEWEDDIPD